MKNQERPRVMFIDDEEIVVQSLKAALRNSPFQVATAGSAADALAQLELQEFDVIVSDERMPGMSGAALLAEVRQRFPETMRMIFTGYSDHQATLRAINEGGVFRYLSKPCSLPDLKEALAAAVSFKRHLTQVRRMPQDQQRRQLLDDLERTYPGITYTLRDSQELILIDSP